LKNPFFNTLLENVHIPGHGIIVLNCGRGCIPYAQ